MNTTTTATTIAACRIDLLAATVAAIAGALPPAAAQTAADALREYAADLTAGPCSPMPMRRWPATWR
jgi:hypothetical protein